MPGSLEPKLSENDQPKDSSELNPVSSKIQGQKPIKGNVASIATLQKKFRSMDKTKKSIVFATGAAIILLSGFWPTGKSDILGGSMSVRCGVFHWNQQITFEGITFNCNDIENRNDYWIEVRATNKNDQEIYDIVAPRSSINLGNNFFLSNRFDINVTRIDQARPVQHLINPNHATSHKGFDQEIWGYAFSVVKKDNQPYLKVSKDFFDFSGSNHKIEVLYNGRSYSIENYDMEKKNLIPIESGQGINSNAPIIIGLQVQDPKYVK
jgi:hypothetical protein